MCERAGPRPRLRRPIRCVASSPRCKSELPRGSTIAMRGQVESMDEAFYRPRLSASAFAVLLVYLLMVVNFQSWLDPFIILTALPGAAGRHRRGRSFCDRHDGQRAGADGRDHVRSACRRRTAS